MSLPMGRRVDPKAACSQTRGSGVYVVTTTCAQRVDVACIHDITPHGSLTKIARNFQWFSDTLTGPNVFVDLRSPFSRFWFLTRPVLLHCFPPSLEYCQTTAAAYLATAVNVVDCPTVTDLL
jgi:hypothetical protein